MNSLNLSESPADPTTRVPPAEVSGRARPLPEIHATAGGVSKSPPVLRTTRRLHIRHTTYYSYDGPVAKSVHRLHLRPIDDWKQTVLSYTLAIQPPATPIEFEDVFGNWSTRFELNEPYRELSISAESLVEVLDVDPFAFAKLPIRPPSFPLVWMPWERTMLAPYLTPAELPDTQLQELTDYGMDFVSRNSGDLMEMLFAMNLALYRDYKYIPGCTDLGTTPYQVYCNRAGVCQDFANLFITIARLLGIPARYVCGYVYTGNATGDAANAAGAAPGPGEPRATSDATHAWVQLYIPNIGWKGFDPTNGVLPQTGHVRVAMGRHYRDATPTSGTLYSRAKESMRVEVEVIDAMADRPGFSHPL